MKPVIAVTMGDFNGIGPEISLKALSSPSVRRICIPILIGSIDVFEYYAKKLKLKTEIREIDIIPPGSRENVFYIFHIRKFQRPVISPGISSKEAGGYAAEAIEVGFELWKQGMVRGIVTAPISKQALNEAGHKYPGQTEMLGKFCRKSDFAMLLVAGSLRVGLATIHLPLRKVGKEISQKLITGKLKIIHQSLRQDFSIASPRIAVLGLNPHSGEHGGIGDEERMIISPALRRASQNGIDAYGPFSSDGFFGTHQYKNYDAVLAMYHDQALIPLKILGFNIGVNYTAGLPIVRTSPDHGTAFDIAGRGKANPSSMIEAIKLAVNIIRHRERN